MNKFECHCLCDNKECVRFHNPSKPLCSCIRQLSNSTKFIERILDCTETIVQVLSICGIHECKAKAARDVIVFGFLHYQIVQDPAGDVLRKKLRKKDIFYDLDKKCRMNRAEAHIAYSIIKRAFKAFYYKQTADNYNTDVIDEEQWMRAAEKTSEAHAISEGIIWEADRRKLENRIKTVYRSFIKRVGESRKKNQNYNCTCCFCKEYKTFDEDNCFKMYANVLPKRDENAYVFKMRLIEEGKKAAAAEPDPCGHKVLEWQNKIKGQSGLKSPEGSHGEIECTCSEKPCCCGENSENSMNDDMSKVAVEKQKSLK